MKIISMLILCFTFLTAYSQVQKTSAIEEVFQKEFSNYEENNIEISLITPPEVLPGWFFNPPRGDQDVFYAIGISDPWIVTVRGHQQAKLRAFCIAGFMNKVTTKGISDVYNKSDQTYKFEQITQYLALPNAGLEGIAIDSSVTKYRERIFLYKFTSGTGGKKYSSLIEYYKSAIKQDGGYSKLEKIELIGKTDDAMMSYKYVANNNDFEIISVLNSDTITIKPTIYQYTGRNKTKDSDSIEGISLFKKGLWQGYFKSLIDNLDIVASDIVSKQKSVSDIKQNGNATNSFNQLSRGVYDTSFSFDIASIELTNKEMVLHLNTSNKQKQN